MAGCLHLFETASAYTEARQNEYDEPWVSYTVENDDVAYNKTEEEKMIENPLTFEITSPGVIKWFSEVPNDKSIEYKKNDGDWTEIISNPDATLATSITSNWGTFSYSGYHDTYGYLWTGQEGRVYTDMNPEDPEYLGTMKGVVTAVDQNGSGATTTVGHLTFVGYDDSSYIWTGNIGNVYMWYGPDDIYVGCEFTTAVSSVSTSTFTTPTINVLNGDVVQFKGDNATYNTSNFSGTTAGFKVKGNIMSLINSSDFIDEITLVSGNTFQNMFYECSGLTDASYLILPATTLTTNCYSDMFYNCTSLTTAPELPATTLANSCYRSMFRCCTSLTTAPELPATVLAESCYDFMFAECTSLTTAPALPATTLANYCYSYMFYGCTSLTTAPELPATVLAESCYSYMFQGCRNLTTVSALPATTLADYCYTSMFSLCSSLATAPALPATALTMACYSGMFSSCAITTAPELPATALARYCYASMFSFAKLTSLPTLPATSLAPGCYMNMFSYCSQLTTVPSNYLPVTSFYYTSGETTMYADSAYTGMFKSCQNLTSVPDLPATGMSSYCYREMFAGCTSLTTAQSVLPGTQMAYAMYESMFSGCTSLTTAPELAATTPSGQRTFAKMFYLCSSLNYIKVNFISSPDTGYYGQTKDWVYGVSSSGTFVKPRYLSWNVRGDSGIPTNWTIQNA